MLFFRKISYITSLLFVLAFLSMCFGGCGAFTEGEVFSDANPPPSGTPERAVFDAILAIEDKDFDLYKTVVPPEFFLDQDGQPADQSDIDELRSRWEGDDWKVHYYRIEIKKASQTKDRAEVDIISGKIRYIGEELFYTKEWQEDDFGSKPMRFVLEMRDGSWRIVDGLEIVNGSPGNDWETE